MGSDRLSELAFCYKPKRYRYIGEYSNYACEVGTGFMEGRKRR
jgi:hypothetical protein